MHNIIQVKRIEEEERKSRLGTFILMGWLREYLMIIEDQALSYDLAPRPPSPDSKLDRRHRGRLIKRDKLTGCGRGIGGGGVGRSQIMRRQESLVPYASFNSLWGWLLCADFLLFCSEKT
jgi:hypothetical protein